MTRIIRACTLTTYEMDHMNRVYSPEGIAPTIHTCGGGNTEPKILVSPEPKIVMAGRIGDRSTYGRRDWVLSTKGTAPTVLANWGAKSPPPARSIVVRGYIGGGFHMTLQVYDPVGLCPTQWANQGKDPIKVVLE